MAKLYNLARMSTATTGTGTITLGSAVAGYLTFAQAGVSDADSVDYAIKDGNNSEHGTGTYTSAGTTLSRTVTKSTNSNNAINLSGTAEVFISPRAETLNDASLFTTGTLDNSRLDGELSAIAGLTSAADRVPYYTGSGTAALATFTSFGRSLVDDADAAAGRTTLGLATIASSGSASDLSAGTVPNARMPSGSRVLLATLTASSSSSLSDTSNFTSSYSRYEIEIINLVPASTAWCRLRVQSGGSFQTTTYVNAGMHSNGTAAAANTDTTSIPLTTSGTSQNTTDELSGIVTLLGDPSGTSYPKKFIGQTVYNAAFQQTQAGYWNNTAAITGIEITYSTGNIASGQVKIYGIVP